MTLALTDGSAKVIDIDVRDWPRCGICNIPVEEFSVTDTGDAIVLVAQCHGRVESAMIPDDVWDTMIGTHVNFGLAFTEEN